MPVPFVAEPTCAVCGKPATRIELIAPGGRPAQWGEWSPDRRAAFQNAIARYGDSWWLMYEGLAGGNGNGGPADTGKAQRISDAFTPPLSFARVHQADFYDDAGFCAGCDVAYCYWHWNPSSTEYGHCPQGHGKSLDPFWFLDDID